MDIALELCDTYVFDYMYAKVLPVQPAPYSLNGGPSNVTITDFKAASPWRFQPASSILSFQPTDAAYMSQWTRDNVYRQLFSLFLITWWVFL
jgi:lathosterol oxidase